MYPEKVNAGRKAENTNARTIGKNANPADLKFTGKTGYGENAEMMGSA